MSAKASTFFWRWPRGLQAVSLATMLVGLLSWQLRNELASAHRRVGMGLQDAQGKVEVLGVLKGGPGEKAGLRAGDRILQVAGREVRTEDEYDRLARGFRQGQEVAFLVERDGQSLTLVLRPGLPPNLQSVVLKAVAVVLYYLLALLVLNGAREDPRRVPLVLFSFAVAAEFALPQFPFGPPGLAKAQEVAFYLLTGWQLALELKLVSYIPRRASWLVKRPSLYRLFTWIGLGVGASLALIGVILPHHPAPFGLAPQWSSFLLDFLVLPTWGVTVLWLLVRQARQAENPLGRQQALLVILGQLPWVAYVLISGTVRLFGVALPDWTESVQSLCLFVFPLALFVAVFRYQFLDLEFLVRRSLVYTFLTGSLVLLFYTLIGAGSAMFSEWLGGGLSVVLVSAATLLLGLLFSPLRTFLQHLIDVHFFPERYAQRQQLVQLAAELPVFGRVQPMAEHLVKKVAEIFSYRSVTLLVSDPASGLLMATASTELKEGGEFDSAFLLASSDPAVVMLAQSGNPLPAAELTAVSGAMAQRLAFFRAELVVPVLSPRALVGLLLLGRSEGPMGVEELGLLSLLAHHLGTVLENARLFETATFDGLTGLWRRETLLEQLEREWQRAQRYQRPLAVGMADLDFFKPINDQYGHLAGDAVLKAVASLLVQGLRSSDLVGRYGGEEFLLVFPETDAQGAKRVAEKLRQKVEELVVRLDNGAQVRTSVSIGVAAYDPKATENPGDLMELIKRADAQLLQAKGLGRNRVVA
ncbi:MAG: diguanylate cyclase [Thermoanaerobaculaceae bacterium]